MPTVNFNSDRTPAKTTTSETFARDAIIAWFRGEFAAANAIIDALCSHIVQLDQQINGLEVGEDEKNYVGGGGDGDGVYDMVFAAIHRRRMNWIPILQMQKYHSIADVSIELKRVMEKKKLTIIHQSDEGKNNLTENEKILAGIDPVQDEEDSPDSDITDGGSQGNENVEICENHEWCEKRPENIKLTKGFIAKEIVSRHKVNVVRGLKVYEDIFTENELAKLSEFVNDLRIAGQNGELPGETFKIFNQQIKGNKRELIQFGEPIFRLLKEETTMNHIEQVPQLLENVIDHLVQWRLIPSRRPNSCVINFFDEGEYSQPYLKPPHVGQPITSLCLSESTMAFGCTLISDNEGNYKAPQMLSLKQGSLLVMRGNSADTAAHAMCPSPTKRVVITLFRVRSDHTTNNSSIPAPYSDNSMTVWQSGTPSNLHRISSNGVNNRYAVMDRPMPKWGAIPAPMVMLTPPPSLILSTQRIRQAGGTGVFLPCNANSKKHTKHLPPRAQRNRLLALTTSSETQPISA